MASRRRRGDEEQRAQLEARQKLFRQQIASEKARPTDDPDSGFARARQQIRQSGTAQSVQSVQGAQGSQDAQNPQSSQSAASPPPAMEQLEQLEQQQDDAPRLLEEERHRRQVAESKVAVLKQQVATAEIALKKAQLRPPSGSTEPKVLQELDRLSAELKTAVAQRSDWESRFGVSDVERCALLTELQTVEAQQSLLEKGTEDARIELEEIQQSAMSGAAEVARLVSAEAEAAAALQSELAAAEARASGLDQQHAQRDADDQARAREAEGRATSLQDQVRAADAHVTQLRAQLVEKDAVHTGQLQGAESNYNVLQEQLAGALGAVGVLEKKVEVTDAELFCYSKGRVTEAESRSAALQDQLAVTEASRTALKQNLEAQHRVLSAKVVEAESRAATLQDQLAEVDAKHCASIQQFADQGAALKRQISEEESRTAAINDQCASSEARAVSLEHQLAEAVGQIDVFQSEIASMGSLQNRVAESQAQVAASQELHMAAASRVTTLEHELAQAVLQSDMLHTELANAEVHISTLEQQLLTAQSLGLEQPGQAQVSAMSELLAEAQARNVDLEQQLVQQNATLQGGIAEAESFAATCQASLDAAVARASGLEQRLAEQGSNLQGYVEERSAIGRRVTEAESRAADLQDQLAAAEARSTGLERQLIEQAAALQDQSAAVETRTRVVVREEERGAASSEWRVTEAEARAATLQAQLSAAEAKTSAVEQRLLTDQTASGDLEARVRDAEAEAASLRRRLVEARPSAEEGSRQVSPEEREELAKRSETAARLEARALAAETRLGAMRADLSAAEVREGERYEALVRRLEVEEERCQSEMSRAATLEREHGELLQQQAHFQAGRDRSIDSQVATVAKERDAAQALMTALCAQLKAAEQQAATEEEGRRRVESTVTAGQDECRSLAERLEQVEEKLEAAEEKLETAEATMAEQEFGDVSGGPSLNPMTDATEDLGAFSDALAGEKQRQDLQTLELERAELLERLKGEEQQRERADAKVRVYERGWVNAEMAVERAKEETSDQEALQMQLEAAEQRAEEAIAKVAEMRNARPEHVPSSFKISSVPFGGSSMLAPTAAPEGPPVTPAGNLTIPRGSSGANTWEVKATLVSGSGHDGASDHGNGPPSLPNAGQPPQNGSASTPPAAYAAQRCPVPWSTSMNATPTSSAGIFPPSNLGGAPSQPASSSPSGPWAPNSRPLPGRSAAAALSARVLSATPPGGMPCGAGGLPYPASRGGQPAVQRLQSAPQPSQLS